MRSFGHLGGCFGWSHAFIRTYTQNVNSPPREAALLELALNASVYWGVEALWGIFDPVADRAVVLEGMRVRAIYVLLRLICRYIFLGGRLGHTSRL